MRMHAAYQEFVILTTPNIVRETSNTPRMIEEREALERECSIITSAPHRWPYRRATLPVGLWFAATRPGRPSSEIGSSPGSTCKVYEQS